MIREIYFATKHQHVLALEKYVSYHSVLDTLNFFVYHLIVL